MAIRKIEAMSRASAVWLFARQFSERPDPPITAIISISNIDQPSPDFNMDGANGLVESCLLSFDDDDIVISDFCNIIDI